MVFRGLVLRKIGRIIDLAAAQQLPRTSCQIQSYPVMPAYITEFYFAILV